MNPTCCTLIDVVAVFLLHKFLEKATLLVVGDAFRVLGLLSLLTWSRLK